jgi:hypothetical protein
MDIKDWINTAILLATIFAIIYGPIRAVKITRDADEARDVKRRQYNILHSLMRTRSVTLHTDHVAALNLVQLEFYGHKEVDQAFRRYREHLSMLSPTDPKAAEGFADERKDRFYTLVQEMASMLGYKFDKADLKRLAYAPQGWEDAEAMQRGLQGRILELLEGRRPLPVKEFHASDVSKNFPPPPPTGT